MLAKAKCVQLEKAGITAFSAAGITNALHFQREIPEMPLAWQAPPLVTDLEINKRPLNFLLEPNFAVDLNAMYFFWLQGLNALQGIGGKFVNADGSILSSRAFPASVRQELHFRISVPERYPVVDSYSAVIFSLEVVHMLASNCMEEAVLDDNNYYVKLPKQRLVGVQGGKVIGMPVFADADISGLVREHMLMSRGLVRDKNRSDVLTRVRTVLWENHSAFRDFQAVDYVLQALAFMPGKKHLLAKLAKFETNEFQLETLGGRLKLLLEAEETLKRSDMTPQAKVDKCFLILMPNMYSPHEFVSKIHTAKRPVPKRRGNEIISDALANVQEDIEKLRLTGALTC